MVSVDEALSFVLAAVQPLEMVNLPLLAALDLVLAADIVATTDIPPFRNSAMDGYAVCASDTAAASTKNPALLRLIGSAAAGYGHDLVVDSGEAVRIMTGAPMPEGADAVVRFEETDETAFGPSRHERITRDEIGILHAAKPWDNVRPAGEDVRAGTTVLPAGTALRPPEIGLLASLNYAGIGVHRRPVVAILSTGDEVIDVGPALLPGQIRNSNSYTIAAMVQRYGGVPFLAGVASDTIGDLQQRLDACREADLIVTSGGVSLGDYDMVKDVLVSEGQITIWQVRMKPGKPLAFGSIGGIPLLGLPGNPVAAAVSFEQFGRPAIAKMLGHRKLSPAIVDARLLERIDNRGHRRHYVRAIVEKDASGEWTARLAGDQGAGVLASLVRANALLVIAESVEVAEAGMILPTQMIDWPLQ